MPFRPVAKNKTEEERTCNYNRRFHSKGFKTIKSGIVKVGNTFYLRI